MTLDLRTLDELLEVVGTRRPEWMREGLCNLHPGVTWFPDRGEPSGPAIAICTRCPCVMACAAYAVEHHIEHGIWGATTAPARRTIWRTTDP